ncbi:protein kinase domain-containing protein [Streptomyces triticirhizae]|uniref:protein kinase domain-containing protein n=1 Tax=Streptomyces triticirhizae TaxID=2483353 RepID=UPI0018F50889|nr:lipopolysaccharide kinase InaA family protein [Streptomyces triticirhizae]
MRKDQPVAGYQVVTQPTNADGGKCMWAFAERDGRQYFIKAFLDPKRPREGGPGNPASVRQRLQRCEQFEQRHRSIMERLGAQRRGGGNLVLATDFFCEGTTYYKVTERIDTSSLEDPQTLEPRQKMVLLRTLGLSLKLLHDIDVVHGDLKPQNVLVQQKSGAGFHVAKLIDFDDSYLSGSPPGPDEIAGDSVYGAPEWRRYMRRDDSVTPERLTTAIDVFALGLMTHFYLTGALPGHDDRFDSPADAVNAGAELTLDPRLDDSMRGLIRATTQGDPARRPRIGGFLNVLNDPAICALRAPGSGRSGRSVDSGGEGARIPAAASVPPTRAGGAGAEPTGTMPGARPEPEGAGAERTRAAPSRSRLRGTITTGGDVRSRPSTSPTTSTTSPTPTTPTPEPVSTEGAGADTAEEAPRRSRVRINLGGRGRD